MGTQCTEIMDLTKVASTFPDIQQQGILRENMLMTLTDMLRADTEVVVVEGPDGIGKTTLLAQFAVQNPDNAFSLFVRSSSRWAYDSEMLTRDLCDQIAWVILKDRIQASMNMDPSQLLRARIYELQRQANHERKIYYFILDGLSEIPDEDSHEREQILNLLPFGLPRFRFILSGPLECLKERFSKSGGIKSFRLPGFTFEETREFFKEHVQDRPTLESIHKVSKMIPGNLASIKRLLLAGTPIDKLLEELPKWMPKFFELEWQVVSDDDELLRRALAILAFDRRAHTLHTLSKLCESDTTSLEKKLRTCNFVDLHDDGREIVFVSEVFKRFASEQLSSLRRNVLDLIISELLNAPESSEALTHLPGLFHQTKRHIDLLNYLSPEHIGKLIDCGDSWIPLHQKADLGVDTALQMGRDGDLFRFAMQRTTIASMEGAAPWRSEIEAYSALDDFSAALAMVQRMVTKEDRLHLLALIARARKTKSLPIDDELTEQIRHLYSLIDKSGLGDRGVDIASDMLYTHPELAIELIQECTGHEGSEDKLDMALANLSFKTLVENENALGIESTHKALRAKVKDPKVQKFVDTVSFFFGSFSAEGVIDEVQRWENVSDRIFALCAWTAARAERQDAGLVVEYALNEILKATTYAANAKIYKELSIPLVYLNDSGQTEMLIGRLDGLKGAIESAGPTEEYVKLQALLFEAEFKYNKDRSYDRALDLFIYIGEIVDPSIKLESLAVLATALKKVDPKNQYESGKMIHSELVKALSSVVDEILTKTADHYEAVRPAIAALSRSDVSIALDVISKLNTAPRRDAAMVDFLGAVAAQEPSEENFVTINDVYYRLRNAVSKARATVAVFRGLLRHKDKMGSFINRLINLFMWAIEIPDSEERCRSLCYLIELFIEHKVGNLEFFERLQRELESSWETMELGWSKINVGFKIVTLMAKCSKDLSRNFLKMIEQERKTIVLDSLDTAMSFIGSVRLTLRCFSGLLKRKLYNNEDIESLHDLINRIPALSVRISIWCELSLRFFLADDSSGCQKIIADKVRPVLESDCIKDKELLWGIITAAAPALYRAHEKTAIQLIEKLPQPYRDEAYGDICAFLITMHLPNEPYEYEGKPFRRVSYEDFLDVIEVLNRIEADSKVYSYMDSLVGHMERRFRKEFSNSQIADITRKLEKMVNAKFPNPEYIVHEGYKILAEAQIARLHKEKGVWDDLITRAKHIPNLADKSFVLMHIAAVLPSPLNSKASRLMREAKDLIPQIPMFEDRCERLQTIAKLSARIDKQISKECIMGAWKEALPLNPAEIPKTRRRLIDFAYKLDPVFAAGLASETDDDPGRKFAQAEAKKRIEVLKLREVIEKGNENSLIIDNNVEQQVELAKMLLSGLNSNRINAVHINSTRQFTKQASQMDLESAFIVFSWVIENAVRRYSDTEQASTLLRPLFEAARISAELAFRIAARIRSITDFGISAARAHEVMRSNLIHTGERDKALEILKTWAASAKKFIKITDPYFGLEELEFVKLIRGVNVDIPIFILTSRKYQQDKRVPLPWDDAYQSHWRIAISDFDAGEVTIVVVGKRSNNDHPIHDRWWLADNGGLRIGTSANSLGLGKISEVSEIEVSDAVSKLTEIDRFITCSVKVYGNDQLKYLSFKL